MDDTEQFAALTKRVDRHDKLFLGDGNGYVGLVARVRTLETNQQAQGKKWEAVQEMMTEWRDTKTSWRTVKVMLAVIGAVLTLLGGGLGMAVLTAVEKIARELP